MYKHHIKLGIAGLALTLGCNAANIMTPATAQDISGEQCVGFETSDAQTMASCDQLAYDYCAMIGAEVGVQVHEQPIGSQGFECVLDFWNGCTDYQVSDAPGYVWWVDTSHGAYPGQHPDQLYCIIPVLWHDVG